MNIEALTHNLYKHHEDYGQGKTQNYSTICSDCKIAADALICMQEEKCHLEEIVQALGTKLTRYDSRIAERDEEIERLNEEIGRYKEGLICMVLERYGVE